MGGSSVTSTPSVAICVTRCSVARAHLVHARAARHRRGLGARRRRDLRRHCVRRIAADSGDRYSVGARRRASAARTDVRSVRAHAQRSGSVGGPRRGRSVGTFDVLVIVRCRADGSFGLFGCDRDHPCSGRARELAARAARSGRRSDGNAQGRVANRLHGRALVTKGKLLRLGLGGAISGIKVAFGAARGG
jgi:hypothetical protein